MDDVLYKRERPTDFKDVIGQDAVISTLRGFGKRKQVPRCLALYGPSGTGKKLGCSEFDLTEINAANNNGVDTVREIENRCRLVPLGGKARVWIIDECHQLTKAAQNAFLKLLEDTPNHVYFFLATTDPQKLLKTVRSRATELKLEAVSERTIIDYLLKMIKKQGWAVSKDVAEAIAEASGGGVRKALVLLDQVSNIDGETAQLAAVTATDEKVVAFNLCKLLMAKKVSWPAVCKLLREVQEDPEGLRWMVMGYANAILTKTANPRAALVLTCFQYNFFDTKKNGLTLACWNVLEGSS